MFRRFTPALCAMRAGYRELDPNEVLAVVQNDGGETTAYYAARYFGPKSEQKVNHILWNDLKKRGHVDIQRGTDLSAPPRWFSTAGPAFKAPKVIRHRPEDHDLSVLKMEQDLGKLQENDVISELQSTPPAPNTRAFATGLSEDVEDGRWKGDIARLSSQARLQESPPE
jgi:hypothetical protein